MKRDDSLDPAELKRAGGRPANINSEAVLNLLGGPPDGQGPMTNAQWQAEAEKRFGMPETTFRRHRDKLKEDRKVKLAGKKYEVLW